jgi:pilus assembly protein CpaB
MNSVFLRLLAVILAFAAILLAWNGYRMNNRMSANSTATPSPVFRIAIAARALPVGSKIAAADIKIIERTQSTQQSYDDPASLIGKIIMADIAQDETFLTWKHFTNRPALASALRAGERGIAIKVNEVIGAGAFLKPGDHVDVLLYLRKDQEVVNSSVASRVLSNVRVIAYGDNTAPANQTDPETSKTVIPNQSGSSRQDDKKPNKDSRSAVLAIAEKDVTRLMLADSSGQIRLALRSEQEADNENTAIELISLDELLAQPKAKVTPPPSASKPVKIRTATNSQSAIIVHRGGKQELVYTSEKND